MLRRASDESVTLVNEAGFAARVLQASSFRTEHRELAAIAKEAASAVLVWDVTHVGTLRATDDVASYFAQSWPVATRCVIDGLGKQSLYHRLGHRLETELIVVPYVGAPRSLPTGSGRLLGGAHWAIIDDRTRACADTERECGDRRVLVTAGGADPHGITELALEALLPADSLDVRCVIGPFFGEERASALRRRAERDGASVVVAPQDLCREFVWADLAVSATGLTKYELALHGLPAVFVSGDESQARAHAPFAEACTGIDMGTVARTEPAQLAAVVDDLLRDRGRRTKMAEAGRRLVDGRGAERVVSAIETAER